ncbi:polymorphic toxin-type HINT domain-containing protein [Brevibacillus porteri]|uniref:polymorphic toxin-type HINT domain-containing protein n=1 Tax=Brevibacillus porteri TaxID=2126350 RepID=UPI0009E45EC0|nr:hypothetical protein A616_25680 [Brevibacillus brevis X23]
MCFNPIVIGCTRFNCIIRKSVLLQISRKNFVLSIETTFNHPFWVEGKEWVLAKDLEEGDNLQTNSGELLTIQDIEIVSVNEKVTVYNFEVADFHTYFVTDLGIWVHNIGDCYEGFRNFEFHYAVHVEGDTSQRRGAQREYGDNFTKDDYYNLALELATSPIDGVDILQRYQGDTRVIYRRSTNDIVFVHADETIGTLYKPKFGNSNPNAGYVYFERITTENPS